MYLIGIVMVCVCGMQEKQTVGNFLESTAGGGLAGTGLLFVVVKGPCCWIMLAAFLPGLLWGRLSRIARLCCFLKMALHR